MLTMMLRGLAGFGAAVLAWGAWCAWRTGAERRADPDRAKAHLRALHDTY